MYGELKRCIHIDFHTMPGIYNFNEKWDAAEFAQRLAEANVKYINAFAKCNLGFSYFDTKIGIPYKGMKGDMLGDLINECHKRDIGVTAYFNLGIDHEMCRIHRDWCKVNRDGQILWGDRTGNGFRLPCYETGYGDYMYSLVKELITLHPEVDGIFLDCINMSPCYGNECLEAIKAEGGDPLDDAQVAAHTFNSVMSFCKRIRELIGTRNLICNSQPYWLMKNYNSHIEVECLPGGGWGYDFFTTQAAYARNIKEKVLYMSGRFQASWGDFGGLKPKASLENDMWDAVSNAVECSIGDHMHPAEILDETVYKTIGDIYSNMMKMEPWTDGAKYHADIGILTETDSGFLYGTYDGVTRMLNELHYTYDIINETMDMSKYKLLILPDDMRMSETLKSKVAEHLKQGKPVLSSGLGGLDKNELKFALPEWNIMVEGLDTSSSPYYKLANDNFRYAAYDNGILMKAESPDKVYANYIKAYFDRKWDGFHGFYYMPPEKETGNHAAVKCGGICHICFRIFKAYNTNAYAAHRDLVAECISDLMPEASFKCESLPSTSRVTLTETDKHMLVHVKVTYPEHRGRIGVINEHNKYPAGGIVKVRGKYSRAEIIPSCEKADCKFGCDCAEIKLPEINGYICIALEKD